ncbi:proline-rich domain-containing protein [Botrimarina hoheduenensis]|uniref:Zinc-finger domain-containing protein n=1 Tax=Botrimarina hoheduenensis TaxID=2528000 RepID=A0A5C5W964_9BACT|nr:proline-rich domain-containing protein [Botrimarina hoheduenensis]TWT46551.1 hypothetical protein Pla111_16470 [Botrimarina hoheduenensis]
MIDPREHDGRSSSADPLLHERLVAYLDRELPLAEAEAIEAEIAANEAARIKLEGLDRVWRALDALPVEKTDADFTRTTLALAAGTGITNTSAGASRFGSLKRGLLPLIWPAIAGFGALAVVWLAAWVPQQRTLKALPLALAADALQQFESLDYLETLAQITPELALAAKDPVIAAEADDWLTVNQMTRSERLAWLTTLDSSRRDAIAKRVASYQTDSRNAERIAERHAELVASEDAERLAGYAAAYYAYAESLSAAERAELRELSPEQRARRVAKKLRRWRLERTLTLAPGERAALASHLRDVVRSETFTQARENAFARRGPRTAPPELRRVIDARLDSAPAAALSRVGQATLRATPVRAPARDDRRNRGDMLWLMIGNAFRESWPAVEEEIVTGLPERLRVALEEASLTGRERTEAVLAILGQAASEDTPDDQREQFESLSNEQLAEYLALPSNTMMDRLTDDWGAQMGVTTEDTVERGFFERGPQERGPRGPAEPAGREGFRRFGPPQPPPSRELSPEGRPRRGRPEQPEPPQR